MGLIVNDIIYIITSLVVCYVLVKLAKLIGVSTKRESVSFIFLLFTAFCGVLHLRFFLHSAIGPIQLSVGLLLDISSLLFLIFTCIVPVNVLSRSAKRQNRL